jgi:hypothetical protein
MDATVHLPRWNRDRYRTSSVQVSIALSSAFFRTLHPLRDANLALNATRASSSLEAFACYLETKPERKLLFHTSRLFYRRIVYQPDPARKIVTFLSWTTSEGYQLYSQVPAPLLMFAHTIIQQTLLASAAHNSCFLFSLRSPTVTPGEAAHTQSWLERQSNIYILLSYHYSPSGIWSI